MTEDRPPASPEPTEPRRPTEPSPAPARQWSVGAVVVGLLLVLAGLAWLLETTDAVEVPWDALFPLALIGVGVALLVSARRERPRGLIAAGIVLTVLSAATSGGHIGVGGVGERVYRPTSLTALRGVPDLGVGQLTLDLRGLDPSAAAGAREAVEISLGIGELIVRLPVELPVLIDASAGIGEVDLPGSSEGGFGPAAEFGDFEQGGDRLTLSVSVGIGQVRVER